MMSSFSFDHIGFKVDGRDSYLISGEFHYFRVPRADWRRRMELLKEAGGNCVATYVPWLIHEPEEGHILFDDTDFRDLRGFLETAHDAGLNVLLRPGPYQCSEMDCAGLPRWLFDMYPEVTARNIHGEVFNDFSISYMHPVFLEKARRYYRAFADEVRPYMAQNGGPVAMLQVDNELMGVHVWFGSLDYNAETMGFGQPHGRYPTWLKATYGDISSLNEAYATSFDDFCAVEPVDKADQGDIHSCRRLKDYHEFYRSTITEYALLLKAWLREDGLQGPICHNSANPNMNPLFPEMAAAMGDDFLLGSDHYYTLNQTWPQNNPTPQYAIRALMSCDTMRAMGMPPSVMEMPGGSPSDTPPILKEDLLACYMANAALGAKGMNLYIYTGGPNVPDTGTTADIYDYNAIIRADGAVNDTYESLRAFGEFARKHTWMQRAQRMSSVQIGFEWNTFRSGDYDDKSSPFTGAMARDFIEKGLVYTLMCSRYAPELTFMTESLDIRKPLIVPAPSAMSPEAQKTLVSFINKGGNVLIAPMIPRTDLEGRSCEILWQALGSPDIRPAKLSPFIDVQGVGHVYGLNFGATAHALPSGARILAQDHRTGECVAYETRVGLGKLIWLGCAWDMSVFSQAEMLEMIMARLCAEPCVISSNRNIFTSLWRDDAGHMTLFLMNLYSGAQSTRVAIGLEAVPLGQFDLTPMEVKVIDLK